MKNYKEFKITINPVNIELVSGLFWQLDIDGINESDNGLIVFADAQKKINRSDIEGILNTILSEKLIESFSIEEGIVEDRNWNEEYEKNVRVIEVTERIVIKPSFKEYTPKENQIIVAIDPKMSFGTGEHATTKLVLQFLDKYVNKGDKVLDIGSGTGVLGITAALLGADKSIGIDNDEWCLLNGTENVKLNNIEDKVEIRLTEIDKVPEKEFDLIVANINKHILIDIAEDIQAKIKKTGTLILSGLLITDEIDITEKYNYLGFTKVASNQMDEWCALVFRNK
jgi:ribosomal protein L11 methyltransferase